MEAAAQRALLTGAVGYQRVKSILEKNGAVRDVKDTVILEDVHCSGVARKLCPRKAYFYWREAWLVRQESERG